MKNSAKLLMALLIVAVVANPLSAAKKPAGAYITSAKIEVLSGDLERYQTAIALLDTLFQYYGPHPQGLFWMNQIMVDLVEQTSEQEKKREYVKSMVAFADSLRHACDNKDIDKKFKKDCEKDVEKADSTLVSYWRVFFNEGVRQVNRISTITEELNNETDSAAREYFQMQREATIDSCVYSMSLAVFIDPDDHRPYSGLSTAYSAKGDFEKSNDYLVQALERTDNRIPLLLSVAYNYIQMNKYCEAIPFMREYVDNFPMTPENNEHMVQTMYNLTICYNNCGEYEEAYGIFHRMLEIEPGERQALIGIGRFHNQLARYAYDSATNYRDVGDDVTAGQWRDRRDQRFDSSQFYLGQAFNLHPDDLEAAEEYGIVCYVVGNFEEAAKAFAVISKLQPDNIDNWVSLGDCYLSIRNFLDAVIAYEKVIEAQPDNREILERLSGLYLETGQTAKKKQVDQKLQTL